MTGSQGALRRLEDWSEWFSPLVVKEVRQIVRGREFYYSFGASLVAGLAVAFFGAGDALSGTGGADDASAPPTSLLIAPVVASCIFLPVSLIAANVDAKSSEGTVVPIHLHRNLGSGWIYLDRRIDDELSRSALALLASHAANALYSAVAQSVLSAKERPFYDSLSV